MDNKTQTQAEADLARAIDGLKPGDKVRMKRGTLGRVFPGVGGDDYGGAVTFSKSECAFKYFARYGGIEFAVLDVNGADWGVPLYSIVEVIPQRVERRARNQFSSVLFRERRVANQSQRVPLRAGIGAIAHGYSNIGGGNCGVLEGCRVMVEGKHINDVWKVRVGNHFHRIFAANLTPIDHRTHTRRASDR